MGAPANGRRALGEGYEWDLWDRCDLGDMIMEVASDYAPAPVRRFARSSPCSGLPPYLSSFFANEI